MTWTKDPHADARTGGSAVTTVEQLGAGRHINLTTYRRTGEAVHTPVGFVLDGDTVYALTAADSGKIKRIRNNDRVMVTPCDSRGSVPTGAPRIQGTARLLTPAETARVRTLLARRYLAARLILWTDRLRPAGSRRVGIEVTL